MSIPPLVCSTPPPPDQCEDEKISDDFDIGYNLSQEYEEQNTYEFNDYCTFNTYKISDGSISIEDIDTLKTLNNEKELSKGIESQCRDDEQENYRSSPLEEKRIDEDNIEDLDLQLEDITSVNAKESSKEFDENTLGSTSGLADASVNIDQIETVTSSPIFDNDPSIESSEADIGKHKNDIPNLDFEDNKTLNPEEPTFYFNDEKEEKIYRSDPCMKEPEILNHAEKDVNVLNNISTNLKSDISSDVDHAACSVKTDHNLQAPYNNQSIDLCVPDDEFGDFDDFQFTSGNVINNDLLSESNPWTNNDAEDITFKANFDEMQIPSVSNQSSPSNVQPKLEPCENDDKFDDFDDFKSSEIDNENRIEIKYETDAQKSCSLSPLDIHLSHSDVQITETVDKVLSSVFQEEIATDDAQPERTLLSFLCETWGHLTEAEVRQPYIVNWNNSLNQKTLLKALCIDSRNILFGPKWNHNMPKYAANLGSSPLQPKKSNATFPSTNDSCSTSALNTDNWSEPINIEGKEYIKEIEKPMDSDRVQTITPEQFINKTKESEFSSFVLSDLNQLSDYNNSGDCMTLKMVNQAVNENGAVSTPVSTIAKTTTLTHNSLVADTKILHPIPASSVVTNHSKQASGQILQPLSLESYTQINWPNPGISLQDLSAFNPVKTIQTIKSEASGSHSKNATPSHVQKNQATDDEMWSDFVSVNPKTNPQLKKQTFTEDDEWSDFVSSPNVNPHNGLNTISLNVHTNLSKQNSLAHSKHKQVNKHIDIPTLNYITPKSNTNRAYTDRHFQNL